MEINIVLMGQRIRAARKEKKVSSEVLAEKVGIAVESLWHIENGARNTSLQTLCNIAEALDVPVDYLLGRMDSPAESVVRMCASAHTLSEDQTRTLMEMCESLIPIIKKKI